MIPSSLFPSVRATNPSQYFVCLVLLLIVLQSNGFQSINFRSNEVRIKRAEEASRVLYYDYFKKSPDKKEIGRIWKNIIFPGIFVEYEDTREVKQTIKIEKKPLKTGPSGRSETSAELKQGTYQAVDATYQPELTSASVATKKLKPVAKPAGFVTPTPKKALTIAIGSGISVLPDIQKYPRPKKPLIIYEFESSAECKKVREACTVLDLIVEYRPCPGQASGFSDLQNTITNGKRVVPFLIDNNPAMYKPQLFGSKEIVDYLFDAYGPGSKAVPSSLKSGGGAGGLFGGSKGGKLRANARPDATKLKPITIYGWEGAPYVKPVRETLNELGLAHIFINTANGSQNRNALAQRTKGIFQVPYIIDPNTGVEMFESAEIVKYLEQVYTI